MTLSTSKSFVIGHRNGRPIVFTPMKYDAKAGQLHGFDHSERPMTLALKDFLSPFEPYELDWEDEGEQFGAS